jgi:hypothetical protein
MKAKLFALALLGLLLFAACVPAAPPAPTPNVALIQTSAAQTVVANFTLTAASWTPTPLPPLTDTPVALDTPILGAVDTATPTLLPGGVTATAILCDALSFDPATVDVNILDGTQMTPGQEFVKTWRVKNNGSCTWAAGYHLIYAGYADKMSGQPQPLNGVVGPGQEVELSVQFKAPTKVGDYVSAWQLANANGKPFPKVVFVKIVVK